MATYFRFQYGHYTLEQMQDYDSKDGGDDMNEGLCACESVSELLKNTVWTDSDAHEAEVVVFKGRKVARIYDGIRVYPTEILATFRPSEFADRAEEIAEQYEE